MAVPNGSGVRGVSAAWSNGNLQFLDGSGNVIATLDGANRQFSLPSGSVLHHTAAKATLSTQNVTPSAAQLLGGVVEHASVTAGGTFTLDTGANLDTALPGAANGDTFQCVMANTGSQTSTITTNTGLTLKGTAAITTGKTAILTFLKTGSAAWTVYITASA